MADEWWIDYIATKLAASVIKGSAVGPGGERATGVLRYIDDITQPALVRKKLTDKAEYEDLRSHGLHVVLAFEIDINDSDGGRAAGVNFATRAKAGADYLGYTGVIFFCNDRPTLPSVSSWQAYLDGAASVLGIRRVGAYGFGNALDAAVGHASAFWQAGPRAALRTHADAWQDNNTQPSVGGIKVDRNLILAPQRIIPLASGGTTTSGVPKEAEMGSIPFDLPQAKDWMIKNFPVENHSPAVGGDMWLTLSSAFGSTLFMVIISDANGQFMQSTDSNYPQGDWGKETTLTSDHRAYFKLPPGANGVSLRWKNVGQVDPKTNAWTGSYAGYAFPQTTS